MTGLRFEIQAPVVPSDPNRADVACFVGLVRRRPGTALPPEISGWLKQRGWSGSSPHAREPVAELCDVPVPIDTWDVFDRLFAWEERGPGGPAGLGTYLGAAVRSFFAQGGRKCYVVRVADPPPFSADRAERRGWLRLLTAEAWTLSPGERSTWRGIGHLFGLSDVSFLALPDLADLVRVDRTLPDLRRPAAARAPERFAACSESRSTPAADGAAHRLPAPRCDAEGYGDWAGAVRRAAELLALPRKPSQPRREMQLVAAVPLPAKDDDPLTEPAPPAADLLGWLTERGWLTGSSFVQLAYPWVRTPGSGNLPEGLESPDAVLAGLLARNALTRGTFTSAAGLAPGDVEGLHPELGRDAVHRLAERVTLFGRRPGAFELLSDVTTSPDETWRPAAVGRLVATLVRAARRLGDDATFEPAGELLWTRLRRGLEGLLTALLEAGALRGATPEEAFAVRCDRSTMSRHDIDQGRVIAEVRFQAALPIDTITVVLAMGEGGQVSLAGEARRQAA